MDRGCHRIEVFINIAGPIDRITSFNNNIIFKREVEDSLNEDFIQSVLQYRIPAVSGERGSEVTGILDKIYKR